MHYQLGIPGVAIRRFADLAGLDLERVRLWTFARAGGLAGDGCADDGSITSYDSR